MCLNSASLFFLKPIPQLETVMPERKLTLLAILNLIEADIESGRLDHQKVEDAMNAIYSGEFLGQGLLLMSHLKAEGSRDHLKIKDKLTEMKVVLGENLIGTDLLDGELPEHDTEFADNVIKNLVGGRHATISEVAARILEIGAMVCSAEEAIQYILKANIGVGEWAYIPVIGCLVASMLCVTRKQEGNLYINLISEESGKVYDPACTFVYRVIPA